MIANLKIYSIIEGEDNDLVLVGTAQNRVLIQAADSRDESATTTALSRDRAVNFAQAIIEAVNGMEDEDET